MVMTCDKDAQHSLMIMRDCHATFIDQNYRAKYLLQDEAELSNEAGKGEGAECIDSVHVLQNALLLFLHPGSNKTIAMAIHVTNDKWFQNANVQFTLKANA